MTTEIAKLLKRREQIRKVKPGIYLAVLSIFGVTVVLQFFSSRPLNPAPVTACAFAATLLAFYASSASKLNLELVERLLELESRWERIDKGDSEQSTRNDSE